MIKVLITRRVPAVAREILVERFEVDARDSNTRLPTEDLRQAVRAYEAVLSMPNDLLSSEVVGRPGPLRVISNYAVGLDNIDVDHARSVGVSVFNTPDVVTESTADQSFAILLALTRRVIPSQRFVQDGMWTSWDPYLFLGEELQGKTFGIIGFGRIGQAVARRALSFGMKVVYVNRSEKPLDSLTEGRVARVELEELLACSDYISVHLPLTPETLGFLDREAFRRMGRRPILINTARGGIVNTDDLIEALSTGTIRGAALDVTDPEPMDGSHPLLGFDNCIVTPHIGTATKETRANMARLAAQNIVDYFSNDRRRNHP